MGGSRREEEGSPAAAAARAAAAAGTCCACARHSASVCTFLQNSAASSTWQSCRVAGGGAGASAKERHDWPRRVGTAACTHALQAYQLNPTGRPLCCKAAAASQCRKCRPAGVRRPRWAARAPPPPPGPRTCRRGLGLVEQPVVGPPGSHALWGCSWRRFGCSSSSRRSTPRCAAASPRHGLPGEHVPVARRLQVSRHARKAWRAGGGVGGQAARDGREPHPDGRAGLLRQEERASEAE